MARFLVVASVNADRIWTLAEKLRPGGRHAHAGISVRIGGAGWYSANALKAAGHEVALASVIGEDAIGKAIFERLNKLGIDTGAVRRTAKTNTYDILADPDGERTLIFDGSQANRPLPVLPEGAIFDGAYVNAWSAISAMPCVRKGAPVLVQLPLRDRVGLYPGTHVVVSRSDTTDAPRAIWTRAQQATGGQLGGLVLTDGPSPLLVVTPKGETTVPSGPTAPPGQVTIGAGDTFAGHLVARLASGATLEAATAEASGAASQWLGSRPAPATIET